MVRFRFSRAKREWVSGYLFILPVLTVLIFFIFLPGYEGIRLGFFNLHLLRSEFKFVGFQQYINLFHHPYLGQVIINTLLWTVGIVSLSLVVGLVFALALDFTFRARNFMLTLIFLPWILPGIVAGTFWQWILDGQSGIFNYLLQSLGVIKQYVGWLASEKTVLIVVMTVMIWRTYPFVTIMFCGGLQMIPQELYEAAYIDGASRRQTFIYITLPQLRYIITITGIIITTWVLKQMDILYVMTGGGPYHSSEVLSLFIYKTAFSFFAFSRASAAGNVLFICMLILGLLYVKQIVFRKE